MDIGGIRTIERKDIYEPLVLKVLGERGIDRCAKVVVADETLADDIVVDARNESRLALIRLSSADLSTKQMRYLCFAAARRYSRSVAETPLESTLPYVWPKMPR